MVRRIVLDDELELLDVEATRGDRRRDHDGDDSRLEVGDGLVAIDLLHAAVKRHACVVLLEELLEELVRRVLPFDENEGARVRVLVREPAEEFEEAVELGFLRSDLDDLLNLGGDDGASADGDLERPSKDLAGEGLHLAREGGGEEDGLTIGTDLVDDFHDLHRAGER